MREGGNGAKWPTVPTKYSASRRIRDLAGVLVTLLLALSNVLGNTVRVFGHFDLPRRSKSLSGGSFVYLERQRD